MAAVMEAGEAASVEDQGEVYRRDGFLVVRQLYGPEEMAAWKARVQAILQAEGSVDNPSGVRVWMVDRLDPYLRERMRDDHVAQILMRVIGPEVEFLSVKAVYKNAQTSFASPWHQDWFYWSGAHKLSVWIALDDATPENGCLRLIPGSHRRAFEMRQVDDGHGFGRRIGEEMLKDLPAVTVPARRGDAVFFHDLTVHGSHPNASGADRWCFISTYRDASVRDESTVWKVPMLVSGASVNGAQVFA